MANNQTFWGLYYLVPEKGSNFYLFHGPLAEQVRDTH